MTKFFGLAFLAGALSASALDWPQWGGPDRNHISTETGVLKKWPEGGPKKDWQVTDTGIGYSGLSISKGKLFVMGGRDGTERLIAKDTATGKDLWTAEIGPVFKNDPWGDGPRGTPTVDGGQVYTMGGQGILIAAQAADGKILWRKDMKDLGGKIPGWGYTESVLVEDGKVYCTPGGSQGAIAALDKLTGEVRWQSKDFTEPAQYSSIVPANINGARHLVQLTMKELVGIDAKNGAVLWRSPWAGRTAVIPSPIVKDNFVYITTGYGVGCKLVKIGPDNKPEDVYENKVMKNHHGGVVLIGEHLYGHSDGPGWICQNFKTGEEVWAAKNLGKGALVAANGQLYCVDEGSGTVVLADASPKGWQEQGRFAQGPKSSLRSPRGQFWTHPVVANGKLYLRDQENLACFDISGK